MTSIGVITGLLQLFVPSYAFRLVRRFGANRVGWFVVSAFACLATAHLVTSSSAFRIGAASDLTIHGIIALASVLLVIGMGHLEALCRQRDEASEIEARVRTEADARVAQRTADLTQSNQQLLAQVARLKSREQALSESVALYDYLFTENPQAMCIIDPRTSAFLTVNQAALHLFGLSTEELASFNLRDLIDPGCVGSFEEDLRRPSPAARLRGVWRHLTRHGTAVDLEVSAIDVEHSGAAARLLVFTNVSDQQEREQNLLKTQRLAVAGRISGSVGQHFNSVLETIESSAETLLPRITDEWATDHIRKISAAANRGSSLTRQLLAVGGRHELKTEVLDVNTLLRGMNHLLARLVGDRIILQNTYGSFVTPILADPRLIEHVIVNLVLNARDAITGNGTITVSTSTLRMDRDPNDETSPVGEFVRLSVRDTGVGISEEAQPHVFEPFFTTRESATALGLGLSSVHGIVSQHGGWVEFTSEPKAGAEFRVFLPCARTCDLAQQPKRAEAPVITRGTILLVEPDDRSRSTARYALTWDGYRVIEADSSSLALLLWESQSSDVSLLMIDATLSDGLSGQELADRLLQARPDLRVLYTIPRECAGQLASETAVTKPFLRDELLDQVRRLTA